jgi:hypothetical protein
MPHVVAPERKRSWDAFARFSSAFSTRFGDMHGSVSFTTSSRPTGGLSDLGTNTQVLADPMAALRSE